VEHLVWWANEIQIPHAADIVKQLVMFEISKALGTSLKERWGLIEWKYNITQKFRVVRKFFEIDG